MKNAKKIYRKLPKNHFSRIAVLSGLALVIIGSAWAIFSISPRADTVGTVSFQAENGTKTGVTTLSDATAAGGSAIRFGVASTGGFKANCIVKPSDCGYPDATNTGVKAGVTLTNSGSVTVTQNGAVVQNLSITNGGQIVVKANNVTIRNVLIRGCTYYPIDYDNGTYSGLVVEDTEIDSTCTATTAGMSFGGYTARRVHVHGTADGFKADADAVIEDSYIHDLAVTAESHNDGLQSMGGNNVTFRHNTCDTNTAGVCIQFGSSASGWLVTDNLVRANGWAFNGGSNMSNNTFTNNRFAKVPGWYGAASITGSNNVWSGNYYDDTGATVNL